MSVPGAVFRPPGSWMPGELLLACTAANIHLLYRRTRLA
jgi:hypothetical protein